jgi:flavin-dependent thymidylate synthase
VTHAQRRIIPGWLQKRREERAQRIDLNEPKPDQHLFVTQDILGDLVTYETSRAHHDYRETGLLRDVAFNNHAMNDGHHISPFDNGLVRVGADGIKVELVQKVDEESFKRVIGMATRATIGVNLAETSVADETAGDDWEEMMRGGLQTALEDAVIVFAVSGVSRTCTHQLVRTRNAAFHQQSQRASYYGDHPEARMPESVWLNDAARQAWLAAKAASDQAYQVACEAGISYQDARYVLLEGTDNYIMCEYNLREFIKVFDYRGCSMFSWEIVSVMRMMREVVLEAHPWLEPFVKISCEKTPASLAEDGVLYDHKCTFQGWESVEGQCPFSWAKEANRTFQPKLHKIAPRTDAVSK